MREPDWMQRQGARPPLPPARKRHPGWLIAGGLLAVGLVGLVVALARNILFASVATVVVVTTTPGLSPTAAAPTPTPASTFNQQLDAYITSLSQQQQIGQLLMLSVYTNAYSAALDGPLRQGQVGSVLFFPNYNGGPLMPTTLAGVKQLISDLKAHATTPLLVATDEEGGGVDRLQYYFTPPSPAPAALAASGDPQYAKSWGAQDAQRMKQLGINVDFAPLADVYQGGAIDRSRMFGTTTQGVITYAGAFLDGLQQNGVAGTLKHWPGIGAVPANPDFALPTLNHSKTQLNNTDFATFRALLAHQPDLIMVTHVLVPAYDPNNLASLSPTLINGVLRGQLGYQGVVVSDAMEAASVTQYMQQQGYSNPAQAVGEASVRAILAGEDLIEVPVDPTLAQGVIDAVTQAVVSGRITPARLQQSLRRIIALKVRLGILTLPPA